jgi:phosphoribosyl-ATP pyrophosphohydrolase/phosphoribosyl-AMP cyclohydrolase
MKLDFDKGQGLIPAIIQHADTGQVLMLGYMNEAAMQATRESGLVTFFSRSRNCLWQKGETSGNSLALVEMIADCDRDTLLVQARPAGPICHQGTISCFGDQGPQGLGWLAELGVLIEGRKSADSQTSYTASLLHGPLERCAQKVGEEAVETVIAALSQTDERLRSESADLVYHLMVLLATRGLSLRDVVSELQTRAN